MPRFDPGFLSLATLKFSIGGLSDDMLLVAAGDSAFSSWPPLFADSC